MRIGRANVNANVNVPAKFEVRSFTRAWDIMGYLKTLGSPWIRRSGSSKVIDFGTNWKRVCYFLLVRHRNLIGLILHPSGDSLLQVFLCSWVTTPLYSILILEVFPLHQIAHVGVSPRISLKLFGREIIFEEFQPMWSSSRYLNVTDRLTDRHVHVA